MYLPSNETCLDCKKKGGGGEEREGRLKLQHGRGQTGRVKERRLRMGGRRGCWRGRLSAPADGCSQEWGPGTATDLRHNRIFELEPSIQMENVGWIRHVCRPSWA